MNRGTFTVQCKEEIPVHHSYCAGSYKTRTDYSQRQVFSPRRSSLANVVCPPLDYLAEAFTLSIFVRSTERSSLQDLGYLIWPARAHRFRQLPSSRLKG